MGTIESLKKKDYLPSPSIARRLQAIEAAIVRLRQGLHHQQPSPEELHDALLAVEKVGLSLQELNVDLEEYKHFFFFRKMKQLFPVGAQVRIPLPTTFVHSEKGLKITVQGTYIVRQISLSQDKRGKIGCMMKLRDPRYLKQKNSTPNFSRSVLYGLTLNITEHNYTALQRVES